MKKKIKLTIDFDFGFPNEGLEFSKNLKHYKFLIAGADLEITTLEAGGEKIIQLGLINWYRLRVNKQII